MHLMPGVDVGAPVQTCQYKVLRLDGVPHDYHCAVTLLWVPMARQSMLWFCIST